MKNKRIGFVIALASVTVMTSGFMTYATEAETIIDNDITTSISTENSESNDVKTSLLDFTVLDTPILAVAADADTQMEAQVIFGDGSFTSSNRTTVEEKGDYTFLVSGLDMGKNEFLNFVLTFDYEGSKIKGSDIEDFSIDITELKIGEVSFNVEGAVLDKSKYDEGFRLFDIIKADEEAYTKAFSEDGDSSGTEARVNSFSVSIHITTLKLEKEEPSVTTTMPTTTTTTATTTTATTTTATTTTATTTTAITTTATTTTTTVVTEKPTTDKSADSETQPASTDAPNTTKASTNTVTTTKANDGTTSPQTGDSGIGVAVALLTTSAAISIAARKRNK